MKCISCKENTGTDMGGLRLCHICVDPLSYKTINKTTAMERYALSDRDLKTTRHARIRRDNSTVIVYLIDDVEEAAINKYGNVKNVLNKIDNRSKRRKEILDRKHGIRLERKRELDQHLISLGLGGIKDDSMLCRDYINKGEKSGYTKERIADIIIEMNFYYKLTKYRDYLKQARREMLFIRDIKSNNDYIISCAKEDALDDYVKHNFLDHRKMIDELPHSLKNRALQISDKYYNNYVQKVLKSSSSDDYSATDNEYNAIIAEIRQHSLV